MSLHFLFLFHCGAMGQLYIHDNRVILLGRSRELSPPERAAFLKRKLVTLHAFLKGKDK